MQDSNYPFAIAFPLYRRMEKLGQGKYFQTHFLVCKKKESAQKQPHQN